MCKQKDRQLPASGEIVWDWELLILELSLGTVFEPGGPMHKGVPPGLRNRRRIWRILNGLGMPVNTVTSSTQAGEPSNTVVAGTQAEPPNNPAAAGSQPGASANTIAASTQAGPASNTVTAGTQGGEATNDGEAS